MRMMEWFAPDAAYLRVAHGPMHRARERMTAWVTDRELRARQRDGFATVVIAALRASKTVATRGCDKVSSALVVMLHLRSCYVSKAAILTLPIQSVPVENRSPA
jgi:hypothetical protein